MLYNLKGVSSMKRILAISGIILLVGLYLSTLLFAIFENPNTYLWFRASIVATIAVPVMIYAYTLIFKYLKHRNSSDDSENTLNRSS